MKRFYLSLLVTVIIVVTPSLTKAQKVQEDLRPFNPVADRVAKAITDKLPDWEHKSVPPLSRDGLNNFSQDVIIDQWYSKEGNVRVAIILNPSEADAKAAFEKFIARSRADERATDVDDEAYAWGMNKSVAFRRGIYTVYISSVVLDTPDNDVYSDKRAKEESRLSRVFAKIVAKALKDN